MSTLTERYSEYEKLLKAPQWRLRRNEVFLRDDFKCLNCDYPAALKVILPGKGIFWVKKAKQFQDERAFYLYINRCERMGVRPEYDDLAHDRAFKSRHYFSFMKPLSRINIHPENLHVHHKMYLPNRAPWEYEDEHLITLCESCHFQIHSDERPIIHIKCENGDWVHPASGDVCTRCEGLGLFPQFLHRSYGLCYKCYGNRRDIIHPDTNEPLGILHSDKVTISLENGVGFCSQHNGSSLLEVVINSKYLLNHLKRNF